MCWLASGIFALPFLAIPSCRNAQGRAEARTKATRAVLSSMRIENACGLGDRVIIVRGIPFIPLTWHHQFDRHAHATT